MAAKCGANLIVGTSGRSPLCARVGVLKPAAATNHRGSQDNPPNDKSRRIVRTMDCITPRASNQWRQWTAVSKVFSLRPLADFRYLRYCCLMRSLFGLYLVMAHLVASK